MFPTKVFLAVGIVLLIHVYLSTRFNKRWGYLIPIGILMFMTYKLIIQAISYESYYQMGGSAPLNSLLLATGIAYTLPLLVSIVVYLVCRNKVESRS